MVRIEGSGRGGEGDADRQITWGRGVVTWMRLARGISKHQCAWCCRLWSLVTWMRVATWVDLTVAFLLWNSHRLKLFWISKHPSKAPLPLHLESCYLDVSWINNCVYFPGWWFVIQLSKWPVILQGMWTCVVVMLLLSSTGLYTDHWGCWVDAKCPSIAPVGMLLWGHGDYSANRRREDKGLNRIVSLWYFKQSVLF